MSRPASPYLSMTSPRVSTARRTRRNSRSSSVTSSTMKPMKAFRSESPSMSAMMSVNYSKEITSAKKNDFSKTKRYDSPYESSLLSEKFSELKSPLLFRAFFKFVFRPSELPPAESLYDELQIARKEIATQKKVITQQKTRNDRLESDLKKREAQMEEILSGSGSKRYVEIHPDIQSYGYLARKTIN